MGNEKRLRISLLLLRLGVFVVMFVWTLDKFVAPDHAARVFEHFYHLEGMGPGILAAIGAVQLVVILGFVAGLFRTWTYGLVLAMHAISTFSSWPQYLAAFDNLLFFAAWPMLAACVALFLLRDSDTMLSLDALRHRS
jgi:putative oxidoreductase